MNARLAKLLVCPNCKAELSLEISEREGEKVVSGIFLCLKCQGEFPIRHGIPRFVSSDAYTSSFSFEWKRWRRTQFGKSSESTFVASTGRQPAELAGKLALDAGCGAGRFMDVAARAGAEVVGVDLSLAVEVAQENLGHVPNCHFIQADLLHLPFRPETFDFIYSIGVLEHTPNTRESFLRVAGALKAGGEIAIWVYPRRRLTESFRDFPDQVNEVLARDVSYQIPPKWESLVRGLAPALDWTMEASSDLGRAVTTRLPPRWLYGLCHVAIPLYYIYRIPLFYPLRLVTRIAMDPDPEWRVLDTFDWYAPRYKWKHTSEEVRGWFEEAGMDQIANLPRPVSVRGRNSARRASANLRAAGKFD